MTASPLRVVFAGLAHSHPSTDAANVRDLGAQIVGVHDADAQSSAEFAARFGGTAVASVEGLHALRPDLVIATPRPQEVVPFLRALTIGPGAPLFLNKVAAATVGQLAARDRAIAAAAVPVGTSSPLRFAPALRAFADGIRSEELLSIRVRAQHDNAAFQLPGRSWQDDPELGGGTMVTVGVHAWELLDVIAPGAALLGGSGWTRRSPGSATRSEDAGGLAGALRIGSAAVPLQVLITGVPGPDAYDIEVVTASGIRSLSLSTDDANESLGFRGLASALLGESAQRRIAAPWTEARTVVANTIRAASLARAPDSAPE